MGVLTLHAKAHPLRRSLSRSWPRPGWKSAGALALLCSTVAWASLPGLGSSVADDAHQWEALGVAPLASGGATGMAMAPTDAAEAIDYAPQRPYVAPVEPAPAPATAPAPANGPIRISGRANDGLYWSLRTAGATPDVAAAYLQALATKIDVGEIGVSDSFDLVLGKNRELLYAGITQFGEKPMQLVKWQANGRSEWIDAANVERPAPVPSGMMMPAAGHITSTFGYRVHPILRFTRFHAGLDIGAGWGSPIVAAADGRVIGAGWAGGYGRQVQIAHAAGLVSSYSHMSSIAAEPGTYVRAGQVIGYVGSSGLSTGPHLHFEVRQGGTPVNPLGVRLVSAPAFDPQLASAVKARLQALLKVGRKSA
ncbi:MAG TPA: M23 family metallopeptidase [Sphingomicrobium sp.]|jgi:murein DD-endopeptidase MepM/ murein hydrolase activator NlpD